MVSRHLKYSPGVLLLLLPMVLFVVAYAIPILMLFASSFVRVNPVTLKVIDPLTLYNYTKLLTDPFYLGVLWNTIKLSFLTTLICLITGYPVALYLSRAGSRERAVLMLLVTAPLLVSLVIRSFGWMIILGRRGLVDSVALALGLTDRSISLMYTQTAVVVGQAHIFYPFMVLSIYAVLQNVNPAILRAAASLGADPWRVFYNVTLPLSVPGVVAGSLIVFGLCVSSFVTPALLGGPWVKVAAYLVWEQTLQVLDWPFAAAISAVLLILTASIMYAYKMVSQTAGEKSGSR
jgi:putative spermidine/putrescine transport system permease protein